MEHTNDRDADVHAARRLLPSREATTHSGADASTVSIPDGVIDDIVVSLDEPVVRDGVVAEARARLERVDLPSAEAVAVLLVDYCVAVRER